MCAGYGGIGLGLKNIFGERLRTIAYCELEGFAQANLISKMEAGLLDAAPIWSDLKTFPYESFHGLVDILIAGYPCQPFSAAGKRAGKDDPRHLWPFIADGIRILRPKLCFFENVEGHISLGLREVIGELESIGYQTAWGIFSASEVGAPHQRKRVFILAVSNSLGGAAGLSRSLAWNEGVAGIADNGGDKGCGELADDSGERLSLSYGQRNGSAGQRNAESQCCGHNAWPSRPGEPQHGWEPPRVVANDHRPHARHGQQRPERELGDLSGGCGEGRGELGDSTHQRDINETEQNHSEAGADTDRASEGAGKDVANTFRSRREEPEHLDANLPSEPSGGDSEGVGNADHGRLASGIDAGSGAEADRGGQSDIEQAEPRQAQPSMGRDAPRRLHGVDLAELSGLSHQELAEICEWMVRCDNRTDELRLLGNGVVPATAERAFRVLIEELI